MFLSRTTGRVGLSGVSLGLCLATLLAVSSGCGYHIGGRAARLPSAWKTIAVPAFLNRTSHYRIEQRLTQAVIGELLARSSYRIVADEGSADAVLRGEVTGVETSPLLYDVSTGRVTTMLVTVHAQVRLFDRATQKVEYQQDNFVFREEYQISTDAVGLFEEQDPALERLARDFASRLVAGMMENF